MKYVDFIKDFNLMLNENGIKMTQSKLKELFELFGDYILENIKEEEKIPLKEFLVFETVVIPPKKLPNGNLSEEQLGLKVRLTDNYKEKIKSELNKK